MPNQGLAEEFYKPIIGKFEKRKVQWSFIDNILIKKFLFYYVLLIYFGKYSWVVSLKDKKDIAITNAFQTMLDKSSLKPKK